MTPVNAAPYIPQRPPILLVDTFLECDDQQIVTDFLIPENHIFVQNGALTEAGVLENIAQTCATRIGWLNHDKPIRIGVIGSISKLQFFALPPAGRHLRTKVEIIAEVFDAIIVKAEVQCNDKQIAECEMKVFVMDVAISTGPFIQNVKI